MYIENADDLNRKYGQSYALYDSNIAFIHDFGQLTDGTDGTIRVRYSVGGQELLIHDVDASKVPIEPIYFDARFVNVSPLGEKNKHGGYSIVGTLVRRRADRQWKRGVCGANTWIYSPISYLYGLMGHGNVVHQLTFDVMRQLVSPVYPSFNEAMEYCDKHTCVAFDPMYCVMLSSISPDKYLVASQHGFIGESVKGHIWIMHDHSQQEFKDFIRRSGQAITMEVSTCPTLKTI